METRPRSSTRATKDDSGSAGAILELLGLFAVVYAFQWITAVFGTMSGLFVLSPPLSDNPWTIVTSVYAHGGPGHLLSNSLALIIFGWPVARATTRLRFHTFFVVTGAIAGISQILITNTVAATPLVAGSGTVGVLGASGAVFALLGYLIASNRLSASLASFVMVPQWVSLLVFLALATAVTLATAAPGVALIAHFSGLFIGLLAGRARLLSVGQARATSRSTV